MKILIILLILGLITGIVLIILGKVEFAGIIWSVTALISFIAYRKKKIR